MHWFCDHLHNPMALGTKPLSEALWNGDFTSVIILRVSRSKLASLYANKFAK